MMLKYNTTEGFTLGSEGSGTIVQVGEGVDEKFIDVKVTYGGASWSQYCVRDWKKLCIFGKT